MTKKLVRNQFDRIRVKTEIKGKSRTQQQFKNECDINNVVKAFAKNGVVHHLNQSEPNYGYVDSRTYHECLNVVRDAHEMFNELPAEVRRKFDDNPMLFMDFVHDDANGQELYDLGLLDRLPDNLREQSVAPSKELEGKASDSAADSSPAEGTSTT
jgi:phage internal scaffolding protein